jgi:FMN phosphatase YigB (HAD superfamily)
MRAVFFDIGETLISESRIWSHLAGVIEIPPMTLFGVLGSLIADRVDHRNLFDIVRPDLGWEGVTELFRNKDRYLPEDLYSDAIPTLAALKDQGYFVGIVGNQSIEREADLLAMNLPAHLVATSAGWTVRKPDPAFFERLVHEAGCRPSEIAYVGDRIDNDIVPVAVAGLVPIHIVRGAWGYIQKDWPEAAHAHAQITSLAEVPRILARLKEGNAP